MITELDRRFDQEGLQVAAMREQTVIDATNGDYSGFNEITSAQLPDQIDTSRLHMQLTLLGDHIEDKRPQVSSRCCWIQRSTASSNKGATERGGQVC